MSINIISKENEIKMHGYEKMPDMLKPDSKILETIDNIASLNLEKKKYILNHSSKKVILTNTKRFMQSHFKLHKIPYKNSIMSKIDYYTLLKINDIEKCLNLYNKLKIDINPFSLPVHFSSSNISECMVVENATFIQDDYFLKNINISYRSIILPPSVTEITESSYVHEITHTQLTHVKGIIKEYYNSEILSIFLELLNLLETPNSKRLLPLGDAIRMIELQNDILILNNPNNYQQDDLLEASKYAASISKAYGLFLEYYYGTVTTKKYILSRIQNIFDGNLQLENLLEEFNLTFENCLSDKRLIKYLTR